MRWLFCILVIVVVGTKANAQIQLQNPSMEGTSCWGPCDPPLEWSYCEALFWVVDTSTTFWPEKVPNRAYDSIAYVILENQASTNDFGSISQKVNCAFNAGFTYSLSVYCASWFEPNVFDSLYRGYLSLYLGVDSCDRQELVWQSPLLDSVWSRFDINFTPSNNSDWFILWPMRDTLIADIAVDALSPIYLINANQVNALSSDTAIYAGNCVSLEASSTNTTYDSLYWINATTNTTFSPNQWNTLVCPDSSTMYLIAMRDSVTDCAGYKWSYDTIRVQVIDTTTAIGKAQLNNFALSVYPNPAKETVMIKCIATDKQDLLLQAVDALGQVVYQQAFSDSQQLNVAHWPAGMYCFTLSQNGQPLATARFLKE